MKVGSRVRFTEAAVENGVRGCIGHCGTVIRVIGTGYLVRCDCGDGLPPDTSHYRMGVSVGIKTWWVCEEGAVEIADEMERLMEFCKELMK